MQPIWVLGVCRGGGGGGEGSPKGLVDNLLLQILVPESYFFYLVATHNDQSRFVKHALGRIGVLFTILRACVLGGGGGPPKGLLHNLLLQLFIPGSSKIEVSQTFFLIWSPLTMTIQAL